jgi:hypothetical protein
MINESDQAVNDCYRAIGGLLTGQPILVIGPGTVSLSGHAAAIDGVVGPVPLISRPIHAPGIVVEIIVCLQAAGIVVSLEPVRGHSRRLEEIAVLPDQAAASGREGQTNRQAKKKGAHTDLVARPFREDQAINIRPLVPTRRRTPSISTYTYPACRGRTWEC